MRMPAMSFVYPSARPQSRLENKQWNLAELASDRDCEVLHGLISYQQVAAHVCLPSSLMLVGCSGSHTALWVSTFL